MRHEEHILVSRADVIAFCKGKPWILTSGDRTTVIEFEGRKFKQPRVKVDPADIISAPSDNGSGPGKGWAKGKTGGAVLKPGHKCKFCDQSFSGKPVGVYAAHLTTNHRAQHLRRLRDKGRKR